MRQFIIIFRSPELCTVCPTGPLGESHNKQQYTPAKTHLTTSTTKIIPAAVQLHHNNCLEVFTLRKPLPSFLHFAFHLSPLLSLVFILSPPLLSLPNSFSTASPLPALPLFALTSATFLSSFLNFTLSLSLSPRPTLSEAGGATASLSPSVRLASIPSELSVVHSDSSRTLP